MFLLLRLSQPVVAEQDPAEDSCKASSSEKVHPPNVAIWVRVAEGGGVEVAMAVVASFVCVTSLVDVASAVEVAMAVVAAVLLMAQTQEQRWNVNTHMHKHKRYFLLFRKTNAYLL